MIAYLTANLKNKRQSLETPTKYCGAFYSMYAGLSHAQETADIPPVCLNTGTQLQTVCQPIFDAAQEFFGIQYSSMQDAQASAVRVTQAQIDEFITKAPVPSAE